MWFMTLVRYVALLIQVTVITVSAAAGLYYAAELVEEYSTLAKKIIWWMNLSITGFFIFLWIFESFPLTMILCGLLAQMCHFVILSSFPNVIFSSPFFILSVIFLILNHYLAFGYFASEPNYTFLEMMSYFTIYLWSMPVALFVSLTANDNVLPTTTNPADADVVSSYLSKRGKKYGLLTLFNYTKESLLPVRTKKGF